MFVSQFPLVRVLGAAEVDASVPVSLLRSHCSLGLRALRASPGLEGRTHMPGGWYWVLAEHLCVPSSSPHPPRDNSLGFSTLWLDSVWERKEQSGRDRDREMRQTGRWGKDWTESERGERESRTETNTAHHIGPITCTVFHYLEASQ